jgi:hypothetical protein
MSAPRRQPPAPELPRIPVRFTNPRPPAHDGFFRPAPPLRTWPRDSDPPLQPRLAAAGTGPRTEEFSVAELDGDRYWDDGHEEYGSNTGRHRAPRKPILRAAMPIVAVVAASGGAFVIIHEAVNSQAQSSSSASDGPLRSGITASTTDLTNAPASVGGGSVPASSSVPLTTNSSGTVPSVQAVPAPSGAGQAVIVGRQKPAPTPAPLSAVRSSPMQATAATSVAVLPPLPSSIAATTPAASPTPAPTPTGTPTPAPSSPPTTTPTPTPTPTTPPTTTTPSPTQPTPTQTTPTPAPTPTPSTPATLSLGATGSDVSDLQTRLDRLFWPTWVPVTGVYDNQTVTGVTYIQQLLHVVGDPPGVYGPATRAALVLATP